MDEKDFFTQSLGLPAEAFDSQSFWDAMDLVREERISQIEKRSGASYQVLTDVLLYDTPILFTYIDIFTPCQLPQRYIVLLRPNETDLSYVS